MYIALHLQKRLRPDEATITVVDPQSYMTYQPFLPEAAAGNLEPRHVVVPLRRVLDKCEIINGRIEQHRSRAPGGAVLLPNEGPTREIAYDIIVVCPGSIARTLPIPGLAEHGIGFKTVAEAIYLRNHVLGRIDMAASTDDEAVRRRALTFVFVGGGYAGIEALAELEDMAREPAGTTRPSTRTTCAGCSSRRPAASCRRSRRRWATTPSTQLHRARHRRPPQHPAEVGCGRPHRARRRRRVRRRDAGLDGRGAAQSDAGIHRPAARRPSAG